MQVVSTHVWRKIDNEKDAPVGYLSFDTQCTVDNLNHLKRRDVNCLHHPTIPGARLEHGVKKPTKIPKVHRLVEHE